MMGLTEVNREVTATEFNLNILTAYKAPNLHCYESFRSSHPSCLSCAFHSKLLLALLQLARSRHIICGGQASLCSLGKGSWNGFDCDHRSWNTVGGYHKHFVALQALYWVQRLSLSQPAHLSRKNPDISHAAASKGGLINLVIACTICIIFIIALTSVLVQFNWCNWYMSSIVTNGRNKTNYAFTFILTSCSAPCTRL